VCIDIIAREWNNSTNSAGQTKTGGPDRPRFTIRKLGIGQDLCQSPFTAFYESLRKSYRKLLRFFIKKINVFIEEIMIFIEEIMIFIEKIIENIIKKIIKKLPESLPAGF